MRQEQQKKYEQELLQQQSMAEQDYKMKLSQINLTYTNQAAQLELDRKGMIIEYETKMKSIVEQNNNYIAQIKQINKNMKENNVFVLDSEEDEKSYDDDLAASLLDNINYESMGLFKALLKDDLFERWYIIFSSKQQHSISFQYKVFRPMVNMSQSEPYQINKMRYDNYKITDLNNKTNKDILRSFIGWILTVKCEYHRCKGRLKLDCFCTPPDFQRYCYYFILRIISFDGNTLIDIIQNMKSRTISKVGKEFYDVALTDDLKQEEYAQTFKEYMLQWMRFDLYNFECDNCHHINKSIMINRIFEYSVSLKHCRLCSSSRKDQFIENAFDLDKAIAHRKNTKYVNQPGKFDKCKFQTGQVMRYCVLSPKFTSFAQEILLNEVVVITKDEWDLLLNKAKKKMKKINQILKRMAKTAAGIVNHYVSHETDINFGINHYETIGINHLIAVMLYKGNQMDYGSRFVDSFWCQDGTQNNFYWLGRYLFEAVFFFGDRVDEINNANTKFYQGHNHRFYFDSFATTINCPISSTGIGSAKRSCGDNGSLLEYIPKYYGPIDNTKAFSLKWYSSHSNNDEWLFMGSSKLQIIFNTFTASKFHANYQQTNRAILYLEKLLLQNTFDVQFYATANGSFYESTVMQKAFDLIDNMVKNDIKSWFEKTLILPQYYSVFIENGYSDFDSFNKIDVDAMDNMGILEKEHKKQILSEIHVLNVFNYWRKQKTFVRFETLKLEMKYMDYKLKTFLYNEKVHAINKDNVMELFPHLTSYTDINGNVVLLTQNEQKTDDSEQPRNINRNLHHQLLINAQIHQIPEQIASILEEEEEFKFGGCDNIPMTALTLVLKQRMNYNLLCDKQAFIKQLSAVTFLQMNIDKLYCKIMQQLKMESANCIITFVSSELKKTFNDYHENDIADFVLEIDALGISEKAATTIYTTLKSIKAENPTQEMMFLSLMNNENIALKDMLTVIEYKLQQNHANYVNIIDAALRELKITVSIACMSKLSVDYQLFESLKIFASRMNAIGVNESVATNVFNALIAKQILPDNWRDKITKLIVSNVKTSDIDSNAIGAVMQKTAFITYYGNPLYLLSKALLKRDNIKYKEIHDGIVEMDIFDGDIQKQREFARKLFNKVFEDRERINSWNCKLCGFKNAELMVGGLWYYYNELAQCGFCGEQRYSDGSTQIYTKSAETNKDAESQQQQDNDNDNDNTLTLPPHIVDQWANVSKTFNCTISPLLYVSVSKICQVIETQIAYYFEVEQKHEHINAKSMTKEQTDDILEYINKNNINGIAFSPLVANTKSIKKLRVSINKSIPQKPFVIFMNGVKKKCNDMKVTQEFIEHAEYKEFVTFCPSMQRIQILTNHFEKITPNLAADGNYPYRMKSFLSSLPDYGADVLLADIEHIKTHKITAKCKCRYINKDKCPHFQRAIRNRSEKQCTKIENKKKLFKTDYPSDFIYISMLDRAHSVLKHTGNLRREGRFLTEAFGVNQALQRDVSEVKKREKTEQRLLEKEKMLTYKTGVFMEYHSLSPRYPNFLSEVTHNEMYHISSEQLRSELDVAKLSMKNVQNKENKAHVINFKATKTDNRYGIVKGELIRIEMVMAIKCYCNYSRLCTEFRSSFFNFSNSMAADIIRQHCDNFYWFGRFLFTAVEFFGKSPRKKDKFYHGLNYKFKFDNFSTTFETPTSTTYDLTAAANFTNSQTGIILQLSPKFKNEGNYSKYLDVNSSSDFAHEKERLFAGFTVLSIVNIYNTSDNAYGGYAKYISVILYFERITEQTAHTKNYYWHGVINDDNKHKHKEKQNNYLLPLLVHQRNRNKVNNGKDDEKEEKEDIPGFILSLFEHFCDIKIHIDLSCIGQEIKYMHESILPILIKPKSVIKDDILYEIQKYEINHHSLKQIFPKLFEYKNSNGYWINIDGVIAAHNILNDAAAKYDEYDASNDIAHELECIETLRAMKKTCYHYYQTKIEDADDYEWKHKKFIIENKELLNLSDTDFAQICSLYEAANSKKMDEETANFKNYLLFVESVKQINNMSPSLYQQIVNREEWDKYFTDNGIEDWVDYDSDQITKAIQSFAAIEMLRNKETGDGHESLLNTLRIVDILVDLKNDHEKDDEHAMTIWESIEDELTQLLEDINPWLVQREKCINSPNKMNDGLSTEQLCILLKIYVFPKIGQEFGAQNPLQFVENDIANYFSNENFNGNRLNSIGIAQFVSDSKQHLRDMPSLPLQMLYVALGDTGEDVMNFLIQTVDDQEKKLKKVSEDNIDESFINNLKVLCFMIDTKKLENIFSDLKSLHQWRNKWKENTYLSYLRQPFQSNIDVIELVISAEELRISEPSLINNLRCSQYLAQIQSKSMKIYKEMTNSGEWSQFILNNKLLRWIEKGDDVLSLVVDAEKRMNDEFKDENETFLNNLKFVDILFEIKEKDDTLYKSLVSEAWKEYIVANNLQNWVRAQSIDVVAAKYEFKWDLNVEQMVMMLNKSVFRKLRIIFKDEAICPLDVEKDKIISFFREKKINGYLLNHLFTPKHINPSSVKKEGIITHFKTKKINFTKTIKKHLTRNNQSPSEVAIKLLYDIMCGIKQNEICDPCISDTSTVQNIIAALQHENGIFSVSSSNYKKKFNKQWPLHRHRDAIMEYFQTKNMNGKSFKKLSEKDFPTELIKYIEKYIQNLRQNMAKTEEKYAEEEDNKENDLIIQINNCLKRYYGSLHKTYNDQFKEFCKENEMDSDEVAEQLEQRPKDCDLVDFDKDKDKKQQFPFKLQTSKEFEDRFIYNILNECGNNPNAFKPDTSLESKDLQDPIKAFHKTVYLFWVQKLEADK